MRFELTSQAKLLLISLLALLGIALAWGFMACRSDRITVDANSPNTPQYAYRLHELAQLQMLADDIQNLERKKQYGQIYDDYASAEFRRHVSRRQFLIMTNCVESYLGALQEYNPNDLAFRREEAAKTMLDVLNRRVLREFGEIEEQMVFVPYGVGFRLNGLYWISKDKHFLQCIAQSEALEFATRKSEPPQGTGTVSAEKPAATAAMPSADGGETSARPVAGVDSTPSGPLPEMPGKPGTAGVVASPPPAVQEMKPVEAKQDTLRARPAGAGAVKDIRPGAKPAERPELEGGSQNPLRLQAHPVPM